MKQREIERLSEIHTDREKVGERCQQIVGEKRNMKLGIHRKRERFIKILR